MAKPIPGGSCDGHGRFLDPENRDPNYLSTCELFRNPWFRQVLALTDGWGPEHKTSLHIDVHGCRDPPGTPSHITLGLGAMHQAAERGQSSFTVAHVEAFGMALATELKRALHNMDLRPHVALVRVAIPGGPGEEPQRFTGARPPE